MGGVYKWAVNMHKEIETREQTSFGRRRWNLNYSTGWRCYVGGGGGRVEVIEISSYLPELEFRVYEG
jgi:hypothetical protein